MQTFLKNAAKWGRQHARSSKGRLLPKAVCLCRLSSNRGVFHRKLSSSFGRIPQKVFFQQRLSSTDGRLSPKVVFHQRSYSTEGRLPIEGRLPPKVSSTYHNTLVHLLFVRAVNIPNLSFLLAVRMMLNA